LDLKTITIELKKNSKENKKREPSFEGSLFLLILNLMFKYLL